MSVFDPAPARSYRAYGLVVSCPWEFKFPSAHDAHVDIVVRERVDRDLPRPPLLPGRREPEVGVSLDGTDYVRWDDLFEFLISPDGREIQVHAFGEVDLAALEVYLFGAVLSFSLIKLGWEPMHATVVVVDDRGVALMGQPGEGKSTLAARFLAEGHRVLTDDLLLMDKIDGGFLGRSGLPRLKLNADSFERLAPEFDALGTMNPLSGKMILKLTDSMFEASPVPIVRLYKLEPAGREAIPASQPMHGADAFSALTGNVFNSVVTDRARLTRQLAFAEDVCGSVPIAELTVPRDFDRLPETLAFIQEDARGATPRRPVVAT